MRDRPSILHTLLASWTSQRVVLAEQGATPMSGSIYVACPNHHLLVQPDGTLGVSKAERVNFCRPSADVLFTSVAEVYGPRAIAVVLTGYGQDGAFGIRTIQKRGGFAIAQDKMSSEIYDIPRAARDIGGADLTLPLEQIAAALLTLASCAV